MKIEDRNLLLKDLCARLPYQVEVQVDKEQDPYILLGLNVNTKICVVGQRFDDVYATRLVEIERIKPHLRPMYNISKEEYKEYHALIHNMEGTNALISYEGLTEFFNRNHFNYRLPENLIVTVRK